MSTGEDVLIGPSPNLRHHNNVVVARLPAVVIGVSAVSTSTRDMTLVTAN